MSFTRQDPYSFELSPIKAIELEAARIGGVVSLAQGIPSFPTPQVIRDYVTEMIHAGKCDKYSLTLGLPELREEIAASLASEGLHYKPESEILCTAGSIEGITAALLASTKPHDEVILPSPTYASYLGGIGMAHCVPRYVELDEENNFDFKVESIARAINKRTKVILFCTPNNPTGTLFSEQKTRELVRLAEEHDLTIIVDEVYKDFYYTDEKHFTPALIPEARHRIIRVCSFSKAYAMTGWRIGFLLANQERVRRILKFHDAMVTCAPVVSQYAGIAALRYGGPYLKEFGRQYKERRDLAIKVLDEMSLVLDYQTPKATYFVFPRIKDTVPYARDVRKLAYDMLYKAKVAVVPGDAFGPTGQSHIRINFGREMDELKKGLERMADYFAMSQAKRILHKELAHAPQSTLPVSLPQRQPTLMAQLARRSLAFCARLYLRRHRPLIVGIVGLRGKTTFKRNISELMGLVRKTRANILSYNTEFGLPLSILNLKSPRTTWERMSFPFKLIYQTLFQPKRDELLILEYGISSRQDAEALLRIARPDWLVMTPFFGTELNVNYEHVLAGVQDLCNTLPRERILWPSGDPMLKGLALDRSNSLDIAADANSMLTITTKRRTYQATREFVGNSANLSAVAAVKLAEELGAHEGQIHKFLA